MATVQINQLPPISSGSVDSATDVLAIVDNSTGVTHEITVDNLKGAMNVLFPVIQAGTGTNSSVRVDSSNTAVGNYSIVAGGQNNTITASGSCSGILSGNNNQVSGSRSVVAGGSNNRITYSAYIANSGSFIGGGSNNCVSGQLGGVIVGGINNRTSNLSSVVGGQCNTLFAACAFIGGGQYNTITEQFVFPSFEIIRGTLSSILSGQNNTIVDVESTILAGTSGSICGTPLSNTTLAFYTGRQLIGNGFCNRIHSKTVEGEEFGTYQEGFNNSILNGSENLITGSYYISNNAILGGTLNQITSHISNCSGSNSTIGGGRCNTIASSCNSVIGGGTSNTMVSASIGTIAGGETNTLTGFVNTIGGGSNNTVTSPGFGTVSGGYINCVTGEGSNIAGGISNTVLGTNSGILAGNGNTISGGCYSVIAGGNSNTASAGNSTVGGGRSNTASGYCSTVSGGYLNVASGNYSAILGGRDNSTNTCTCAMIIGACITADRNCATFVNNLSIKSIPTASAGLPSGAVWSNSGVLNIVT
jgi:hypothetical protein